MVLPSQHNLFSHPKPPHREATACGSLIWGIWELMKAQSRRLSSWKSCLCRNCMGVCYLF